MGKRLKQIKYDQEGALVHSDQRRSIYDPKKILEGIGKWYPHSIIRIEQDNLILGNHYHDYKELFFTPTGNFHFRFVDLDDLETKDYDLKAGERIIIPEGIGHAVAGNKGNILLGYGNVLFNPKGIIPCPENALEALSLHK